MAFSKGMYSQINDDITDRNHPDDNLHWLFGVTKTITEDFATVQADLMEVRNEQNITVKFVEFCHKKFNDLEEQMIQQANGILRCMNAKSIVEAENLNLKMMMKNLKKDLLEAQQFARSNTIEISGVPLIEGENLLSILQKICLVLGMELEDKMVDNLHRATVTAIDANPVIFVKFCRRLDKEDFLRLWRIKRYSMTTAILGLSGDKPIFVADCLAPELKRILGICREIKAEGKIKYLWVRGGKIFVRIDEKGDTIIVKDEDTLQALQALQILQ